MSEDSSITVDQPDPRNDDQDRQNGMGRGVMFRGRVLPLDIIRPLTARRILIIPNQCDIVSVLSSISTNSRQAIYILSGTGYASRANICLLPAGRTILGVGRGMIQYMSGWFQRRISNLSIVGIPSSRHNGILHVSISGVGESVAIAHNLIALGPVEVDVMFVCEPGSTFQPDPPGEPIIRLQVNAEPEPEPAPEPAPAPAPAPAPEPEPEPAPAPPVAE